MDTDKKIKNLDASQPKIMRIAKLILHYLAWDLRLH